MNQYAVLLGYFDKQMKIIEKLFKQVVKIDVTVFEKTFIPYAVKLGHLWPGCKASKPLE